MSSLTYLFDINFPCGKQSYFTSFAHELIINDIIYLPNSGLNLISGEFNDSAQDNVVIKGIFEQGGIEKRDRLGGSKVKIRQYFRGGVKLIANLICTKFLSNDLNFELNCEPESIKYKQSIVQMFSKTCRANFGDERCKISIVDLAVSCTVREVNENIVKCDLEDIPDGYFNGGKLIIERENRSREFKILNQFGKDIELNLDKKYNFTLAQNITLIPTCDKNYRTCCNSFNNAVNFRGEPAIPEYNIIEN